MGQSWSHRRSSSRYARSDASNSLPGAWKLLPPHTASPACTAKAPPSWENCCSCRNSSVTTGGPSATSKPSRTGARDEPSTNLCRA
eukprot:3440641-Prymnesium_polylepis.2